MDKNDPAFASFAALAIGGIFTIAGSLGRALSTTPENRQNSTAFFGIGLAVLSILAVTWLVVGAYRLVIMTTAAINAAPWVALGIVTAIGSLVALGTGWNVLNRRLNSVRRARRVIDALMVKAGYAPEALLRVAKEAGVHERELQVGVAQAHSGGPAIVIGAVTVKSRPPAVTATPLFGESQKEIRESEAELLAAWRAWSAAVEEYDNATSTFPLALVASMFHFPDVHAEEASRVADTSNPEPPDAA